MGPVVRMHLNHDDATVANSHAYNRSMSYDKSLLDDLTAVLHPFVKQCADSTAAQACPPRSKPHDDSQKQGSACEEAWPPWEDILAEENQLDWMFDQLDIERSKGLSLEQLQALYLVGELV